MRDAGDLGPRWSSTVSICTVFKWPAALAVAPQATGSPARALGWQQGMRRAAGALPRAGRERTSVEECRSGTFIRPGDLVTNGELS